MIRLAGPVLALSVGRNLSLVPRSNMRHRVVVVAAASTQGSNITVGDEHEEEETVRKSRFVARCGHASTFNEAKQFISGASDPKARHNCWGWVSSTAQVKKKDSACQMYFSMMLS